jgi:hypothetical protein
MGLAKAGKQDHINIKAHVIAGHHRPRRFFTSRQTSQPTPSPASDNWLCHRAGEAHWHLIAHHYWIAFHHQYIVNFKA